MYSLKGYYKKALVTGGAGFVGSHLVEDLLKDGLEVISIDDYSGGKRENLEHLHHYKTFTEIECDVTDYDKLKKYFDGVDIVFSQMASKMTVCLKNPIRDLEVNAKGAYNVLKLSKDFGVKKVVHISTGSVYGEPKYFPTDENHPYNPTSYYGVSKLAGDRYARLFHHLYGLNTTILRYYHVYGPRQENSEVGGVCTIFGKRAYENNPLIIYGDGTQERSFTYVQDVVNINKLVALKEETAGEAYNCASGIKVTVQELAEKVLKYMNKENLEIKYEDWKIGDIKHFEVDNSKLKKLGFKWETDFEKGLKKTLEWTKEYLLKKNKV